MAEPILQAGGLLAAGKRGRIFGPVDLTLWPRQVCVVHGPTGSGKSALLLALTGRLREATGSLTIDGIDAMRDPYRAMQLTGV
ncbi:ATP-binding cassette domain-containing protein, partial [Streptomyces turgidiscabies]|uniref:ATP-binding cassette domain-containing protein n=1 Tax=Streptomyces turgidiscabies TaxID=85558 RepID=UPI0038F81C2E